MGTAALLLLLTCAEKDDEGNDDLAVAPCWYGLLGVAFAFAATG